MNQAYLLSLVLKQLDQESLLKSLLVSKRVNRISSNLIKITIDELSKQKITACSTKKRPMIQFQLLHKTADSFKYQCAASANQRDIIEFYMTNGYDDTDLMKGLFGACYGGHEELTQFMIAKGAIPSRVNFFISCSHGKKNFVELLLNLTIPCPENMNGFISIVNTALGVACNDDNFEIIKLMINKGANQCFNCNDIESHRSSNPSLVSDPHHNVIEASVV